MLPVRPERYSPRGGMSPPAADLMHQGRSTVVFDTDVFVLHTTELNRRMARVTECDDGDDDDDGDVLTSGHFPVKSSRRSRKTG